MNSVRLDILDTDGVEQILEKIKVKYIEKSMDVRNRTIRSN